MRIYLQASTEFSTKIFQFHIPVTKVESPPRLIYSINILRYPHPVCRLEDNYLFELVK